MTIERGEVDLREVSWDAASSVLIRRGEYRKQWACLEDIENQRDEQRISTGAESVFAVSAVFAELRLEYSPGMVEGRKEGGFVETMRQKSSVAGEV